METVLVAGATGTLGRAVVDALKAGSYRVRALSRSARRAESLQGVVDELVVGDALQPDSLPPALDGVHKMISCVGAPVELSLADRRGYSDVDVAANSNLAEASLRAKVRHIVYVAVHTQPGYADTAYIRAHEAVVERLRGSRLSFAVVRPTGIFPIFVPLLEMARRGAVWIPGDGRAKTNPVHARDVACACVNALTAASGDSISVGGPDVMTRDDIARMACEAVGRRARIVHVPAAVLGFSAAVLGPVHPRASQLLEFAARVFTSDCVAPAVGRHRLADYFAAVVSDRP